jgi:pSer/pThr/pTyr-binding forkhead associated (FHA) protein
MSFRLVPLIKKTAPIIDLQRPILLIGRHMDCDVRLDTPKISRRHCCIAMAYDRLLIRDLGSRNGVRLNGRMIEEGRLESGDEVAIGPIVFRLEPSDERPEASAARPAPAAGRPAGSPNPPPRPVAVKPRSLKPDSEDGLVPLDDF